MIVLDINDKEVWEEFFLSVEKKTFLNSWNWGEFRKSLGDKIWRKGVFEKEGPISLFLITKIKSRKGSFLLLAHCPAFNKLSEEGLRESIKEVKRIAKKEEVSFVRIAPIFDPGTLEEDIIKNLGFKASPSTVFPVKSLELDLEPSEEKILSGMRKSTRYLIKKGLNNDRITVSVSSNKKDLDIFNDLQKKTAKRQGFNAFSYEYLKKEFDVFSKDNQVRLILGYNKNECIAGAFVIFWGEKAFYHHGASFSVSNKIPVSHLVQWEAIKEAKQRGCRLYNFWAIAPTDDPGHKWSGLTRFKKGFGGREIKYAQARDLPLSGKYLLTYWFEKLRG